MEALKSLDAQIAPRRGGRYYYLSKVESKRYGFLYYVRYWEDGKPVNSRWCTHTNNLQIARNFAIANRETILAAYHAKHRVDERLYKTLETYYAENSPYMKVAEQRGRTLVKKTQRMYHNFMSDTFIPFLRKESIHCAEDITPPVVAKLQNSLLDKGLKHKTINRMTGCVKLVFDHMLMDGSADENPFRKAIPLKAKASDSRPRGCYETTALKGVFNKPWPDTFSYLLCLLIYSTGLRNSEIERVRLQDIVEISGLRFINVRENKTKNGIRLAPLHDFVCRNLLAYAEKEQRQPKEPLFRFDEKKKARAYCAANIKLAEALKVSKETVAAQNITFYSGRHFWKTLMNAHELGDVEEYFMGHKVSSDVAKRYNHRDKQGRDRIAARARAVFRILDRTIFSGI